MSVFTVMFERLSFWIVWWQRRSSRQQQWISLLRSGGSAPLHWIAERDLEMGFGQPFLEATAVIAPLLGLIGTVLGLSRLLSSMGPNLTLPPGGTLSPFGDVLISTALGLVVSLIATLTLHLNNGLRQWQQAVWQRDLHRCLPLP